MLHLQSPVLLLLRPSKVGEIEHSLRRPGEWRENTWGHLADLREGGQPYSPASGPALWA